MLNYDNNNIERERERMKLTITYIVEITIKMWLSPLRTINYSEIVVIATILFSQCMLG